MASSGVIEKHHWKLWSCDQATGRETLVEWGGKDEILNRMEERADRGSDVWVIDPAGKKHLPDAHRRPACDEQSNLDWVIAELDKWIINSADRLAWLEREHRHQDAAFERKIRNSYRQAQLLVERAKQPVE